MLDGFFLADAVEHAKKLLYDSLDGGEKFISRRKDKFERDIENIIRLIKNTRTDRVPTDICCKRPALTNCLR